MDIKNLLEETVIHKSFGKGVIKSAYDKYLEIFFPEHNRWSKFLYPSCFDGFLKLEVQGKEEDIAKDVEQWRTASGAAQREKWQRQYVKRQQDMKDRQKAAEEKKKQDGKRVRELRSNYGQSKNKK